ncbi:two-component system OmpR family response regulator [Inquilinus ginsengisoli]|uniref:winged helix-turn-helix domain-containing protein n=1 Tax=Inquilinus ginsengisoli TaxID=363840 RepID=UPI003D1FE9DE
MNIDTPVTQATDVLASFGSEYPTRILVIKGDPVTAGSIAGYLDRYGFRVRTTSNLQDGLRGLAARGPDLVILHLCRAEGLETLRAIRSQSDVPVITITQDDELDRVLSLELGADDCITAPVGLRELVARVRAVLRRRLVAWPGPGGGPDRDRGRVRFGGWVLDRRLRSLTDPAGSPVSLSKGEYALLVAFIDAPQRPLSRVQLLQATRLHEDIFDRSIDVQVLRLRRKLEADRGAPRLIKTERGVGYVFTASVEHLS